MEDLTVKVELRKHTSEKNPELVGFANITLGDIVLKGVAVTERETEKGKITNFQMPTVNKYETKDGETKYVSSAEIKSANTENESKITKAIRSALIGAITNETQNERGAYEGSSVAKDVYNKDMIKAYATPVDGEKLKADATVYVGNVLKLNEMKLIEYTNKENETNTMLSVPSKAYEKDGETKYDDQILLLNGLNGKVKSAVEESYESELQKAQEPEVKQEEDEEEEM